jgi:hypothetical protein
MKIKSILFPAAVVTIVAAFSYYIGGSMRGRNSERQSIPLPITEIGYSVPTQKDTVEVTGQTQNTIVGSGSDVTKKTEEVEADFERRKQKIEDYYATVFRQLRENVDMALRRIDAADKTAYAHFTEQINNTESTSTGYTRVTGRVSPYGTVSADGLHVGTTKTRVEGNPSGNYELKVRQLNKAANDIVSEYKLDLDHYQRQKACALSDLEKEKKFALAAVYNQQASESVQPIPPKARGTVTGILSSDGAPLIIINGKVLSEGQSENGVKVMKIHPDYVEFEKSGSRWRQKVNEPPTNNWP